MLGDHLAGRLVPEFPAPPQWPDDINRREEEIHPINDAPTSNRAPDTGGPIRTG